MNNLGIIAKKKGDLDRAELLYRNALGIYRDINNPAGEASSLTNLGNVFFSRSDFDEAEMYYRDSLAIEIEIGNKSGEKKSLYNIELVMAKKDSKFEEE